MSAGHEIKITIAIQIDQIQAAQPPLGVPLYFLDQSGDAALVGDIGKSATSRWFVACGLSLAPAHSAMGIVASRNTTVNRIPCRMILASFLHAQPSHDRVLRRTSTADVLNIIRRICW